jgi:sugar/nucleoside kinase (ribokinase family)
MISVFGIGNPLMDYLTYEDSELIEALAVKPGTMNLVTGRERTLLLERIKHPSCVPGGSCANTIRGLAWLGRGEEIEPPLYAGAVGNDHLGRQYIAGLRELGIKTQVCYKTEETGISVVVVTPDRERTMFTYLGACRGFDSGDLDKNLISESNFLYTTAYMWDTENQKAAAKEALRHAASEGVGIAFDLADPLAVGRYREELLSFVPEYVDVLFGNKEEMSLLHGKNEEDAVLAESLGELAPIAVMKVGAEGCWVSSQGDVTKHPGKRVRAVDTVGAGDFFAAGFLFGLLKGENIEACARLANTFGAGIVGVVGCSLGELSQGDILSSIRH